MPRLFHTASAASLAFFLSCAPAAAQRPTVPFPFAVKGASTEEIQLTPVVSRLLRLTRLDRVTMVDVPVPGRGVVNLDLRRVPLHLSATAVHVNGKPSRAGFDPTLSLWSGVVVGRADSQAFLGFSKYGSRGWFGSPGNFRHLLARPGAKGDWSNATARVVTAELVQATGYTPQLDCKTLDSKNPPVQTTTPGAANANAGTLIDAPIAFETDFEFYNIFKNLKAAQTYAFTLIGSVSNRYRQQMDVIWTLPYVGFHTTNTDPWTSNACFTRLSQFRTAWQNGKAPVSASLYHMISGVRVSGCGGVAHLNVICNQSSGFAMSAHFKGNMPFPPAQGPLTWDFFVVAHETGHQFGSGHTHSAYSPPIDSCASRNPCIKNGTNMSYCHICSGGMRNITLMFHPRVVTVIKAAVARSCLKKFDGVIAKDLGNALSGSNGTPVQDVTYKTPAVTIDVSKAPRTQPGMLVIGDRRIDVPLFGGILVPDPRWPVPVMSNASGDLRLTLSVSGSYPMGVTVFMQTWIRDPSGTNLFAVSNATQAELIKP